MNGMSAENKITNSLIIWQGGKKVTKIQLSWSSYADFHINISPSLCYQILLKMK